VVEYTSRMKSISGLKIAKMLKMAAFWVAALCRLVEVH
jgi:hypothetical protein